MSLVLTDNFSYDETIGAYDFTKESPNIQKLRNINNFKTIQSDNLPLTIVAFREYGDHNLWWIIATFNNIILVDEYDNDELYIPDLTEVRGILR